MSFISDMEDVIEEVSDWGVKTITDVTDALTTPEGLPFMVERQTPGEQIATYLGLRGNLDAWENWINDQAASIISRLSDAAVSPDEIQAVHPVDMAQKMAVVYSAEMEQLLKKEHDGLLNFR